MENLTEEEQKYLQEVAKQGQQSVIDTLTTEERMISNLGLSLELRNFITDLQHVDSFYPGGYKAYLEKCKKLLHDVTMKINPLQGWTPSVWIFYLFF